MKTGTRNIFPGMVIDIFVVVFFLSTAAVSLHLFRLDLFRTLDARDEEPVGIIVIRNNIIQRRFADRTIWDRLFVDSPVYSGDLIRAADLSAATIYIDENQINLHENTLIRIQYSPDGKGPFQVELQEGNLSISTGMGSSGIMLNLMGRQVQTNSGTILDASADKEGIVIQVNEGSATFFKEESTQELVEGTMIAQDSAGKERIIPAVVVTRPRPNARYLKNNPEPLVVNFMWNRINLEFGEPLRLEISDDPNFNRNLIVIENLDNQALANFNAGQWYWRLILEDKILSSGQFVIADASGPDLKSPAMNSVFRYYGGLPQIRFQWSQKPEASQYILEIAETVDFIKPRISRQLSGVSYIQSELGPGTWYWRVQPVFSSVYEGNSAYSSAAVFRIEQTSDPQAPAIELSEIPLVVIPMIPPTLERVQNVPVQAETITSIDRDVIPAQTETRTAANPGNTPVQAEPSLAIAGAYYTVQPGDTLHQIARRVYRDAALWPRIAEANDIPNPDLIEIDDVFFIPEL